MAITYYVYRIENIISGEFYFGMRGCIGAPQNDLGIIYFTSGKLKSLFTRMPEHFKKKIIYEHSQRKVCYLIEQKYISIFNINKLCRNYNFYKKVEKMNIKLPCYTF
jgi:hypothetical protein